MTAPPRPRPAAMVLGGVAFLAATIAAASVDVYDWEIKVGRTIYDLPAGLDPVMNATWVFGTEVGVLICGLAAVLIAGRSVGAWVLVAGTGTWLAVQSLKFAVDRPRPAAAVLERSIRIDAGGSAFPSGHAAQGLAMALVVVALISMPRWSAWLLLAFALLVGLARVYSGVHWPLDVGGGWILGALGAGVTLALRDRRAAKSGWALTGTADRPIGAVFRGGRIRHDESSLDTPSPPAVPARPLPGASRSAERPQRRHDRHTVRPRNR